MVAIWAAEQDCLTSKNLREKPKGEMGRKLASIWHNVIMPGRTTGEDSCHRPVLHMPGRTTGEESCHRPVLLGGLFHRHSSRNLAAVTLWSLDSLSHGQGRRVGGRLPMWPHKQRWAKATQRSTTHLSFLTLCCRKCQPYEQRPPCTEAQACSPPPAGITQLASCQLIFHFPSASVVCVSFLLAGWPPKHPSQERLCDEKNQAFTDLF